MENEKHTAGPVIWQETPKECKIRNALFRTWNKDRNQKNVENEKQTLFDLDMARNTQKRGKLEMNIVGPGLWRKN